MKRRDVEIFNLSFLDIMTGALGAIMFLFIIVPKGKPNPENKKPILAISIDKYNKKFFGEIPDSIPNMGIADTMLALVVNYEIFPEFEDCPPQIPCPECPDCPKCPECPSRIGRPRTPENEPIKEPSLPETPEHPNDVKKDNNSSKYAGDPPSVPCKFSIELKWLDKSDNVDLIVCKGSKCVSGKSKKSKEIGFWDSGKSRTSVFATDFRTNQEAVRQFDDFISGEYQIFAIFKESAKNNKNVVVTGLVFARPDSGHEKGESFKASLPLSNKEKILLGKVKLQKDGQFEFIKN